MKGSLRQDALVIYKQRPARIRELGAKKIAIETEDGDLLQVRPKDVHLLHQGPLTAWSQLRAPTGEILAAWELLAGQSTTMEELSELAWGEFTPATAWAVWELLVDGLRFSGAPEAIQVRDAAAVEAEQTARAAKAAEERAWNDFLARVQAHAYLPDDERYLQDVVALALRQQESSRTLRSLGRSESYEEAHQLLLDLGYWDVTTNPYPERFGLPRHPPAVDLPVPEDEDRCDLRHLVAFAIDDAGNKDPDDAVSWDGERLWVHVADVAALVWPGSPADEEARARGANLYLPEGTVPMLPPQATALLGLGLADTSPALSFGLRLDADGNVADVEITPSWVQVTRMSYEDAELQLSDPHLAQLYRLSQRLMERRLANGAIEIDLPEVKLRVDDAGQVRILPLPHLASRSLVREAMLIAGEAAARFAVEQGVPVPFTVQDPPDLENELQRHAATPAEMYALRRTFQPSRQSSAPGRHAGLGLDLYVQTTSPLRRYQDLLVHQQLRTFALGRAPMDDQTVMERVAAARTGMSSVRQVERLSNNHWTLVYLLQHPDWHGEGVVVDQRGPRSTVLIPELGFEAGLYGHQDLDLDDTVEVAVSEIRLPALDVRLRRLRRR